MSERSQHPISDGGGGVGFGPPDGGWSTLIEAYLDGVLAPSEAAAFEREAAASPTLRHELDRARLCQTRVDSVLSRRFGVAAMAQVARPLNVPGDSLEIRPKKPTGPRPTAAARSVNRSQIAMAAAAVVMLAVGGTLIYKDVTHDDFADTGGGRDAHVSPVRAYRSAVESGFVPTEVCTTPDAFAAWTKARFGATLRPRPDAAGSVRFAGWSYARVVTEYSGVLLARVNDAQVVLVLDRVEDEKEPAHKCDRNAEGLSMFRTVVGKFVVYEVTPLATPVVTQSLEAGD